MQWRGAGWIGEQLCVCLAIGVASAGCGLLIKDRTEWEPEDPTGGAPAQGGMHVGGAPDGGGVLGGADNVGGTNIGGGDGGAGGQPASGVPDSPLLWLRSDIGLTADASQLTWVDQATSQSAVANEEDTGLDSVPAIVPASPKFNSHPTVRFDGLEDRVLLPPIDASFEDGLSATFVLRAVGAKVFDGFMFLAGTGNTDVIGLGRELTWDRVRYTVQSEYHPDWWEYGISQWAAGMSTLGSHAEIVTIVQRPEDGSTRLYTNGDPIAKSWGDSPIPVPAFRDASLLGWFPDAPFQGDIAEVVLYDRALDAEERAGLEQYLASKYAIELAQPTVGPGIQVIATDQSLASALVTDGERVVWTNWDGGQVMILDTATLPTPLEPVERFAQSSSTVHPTRPFVGDDYIYWGDETELHRVDKLGGAVETVVAGGDVTSVVTDSQYAFASISFGTGIAKVPTNTWDSSMVWPLDYRVTLLAVDDTHLYWSQASGGVEDGIFRTSKSETPGPRELVAAGYISYFTVTDTSIVYVTDSAMLHAVDKSTLEVTELVDDGSWIEDVVVDGSFAYYTSPSENAVLRVPLTGGAPEELAPGQDFPDSIVIVGDWLFWSNRDGTVLRMPKPL